jgi:hypothetical protein
MAATKKKAKSRSGLPSSPVEDLTDHPMPASQMAAQVDPKGAGGATVNAKSMDKVSGQVDAKEKQAKAEEDNSIGGKIRKSELFFVRNHVTGEDYVGISPQNDENATPAEKRLSSVSALDGVAPRTGMIVKPKEGQAFTVGDGYGPDKTPADWASISTPDGKPLFG